MATDVGGLKKLREDRGLTQRGLAEALGITDQTVSNVERGQRPSLDVALAFARFYGVPAEDLFAPAAATGEVGADGKDPAPAGLPEPQEPIVPSSRPDRTAPAERVAKLSEAAR